MHSDDNVSSQFQCALVVEAELWSVIDGLPGLKNDLEWLLFEIRLVKLENFHVYIY